ncbi:Sbal_3080 family lipoprotein [Methylobacillus methanolivorans]|uniref:Sbal_3080 family lipoprotein n=1 Tax=Methylobacillus methanolivorans TaxID=1848927 RepID=A0ABW8GHX8_9PROT
MPTEKQLMTQMLKHIIPALMMINLTACAIHQKVKPVEVLQEKEVCIIENPAVRAGFLDTYKQSLMSKGYHPRQLPASSSLTTCPISSTYTANWRWDLALYMEYAEIKVYEQAKPIGEATYNSRNGGASLGKFIDAEKKIRELVDQLFP